MPWLTINERTVINLTHGDNIVVIAEDPICNCRRSKLLTAEDPNLLLVTNKEQRPRLLTENKCLKRQSARKIKDHLRIKEAGTHCNGQW